MWTVGWEWCRDKEENGRVRHKEGVHWKSCVYLLELILGRGWIRQDPRAPLEISCRTRAIFQVSPYYWRMQIDGVRGDLGILSVCRRRVSRFVFTDLSELRPIRRKWLVSRHVLQPPLKIPSLLRIPFSYCCCSFNPNQTSKEQRTRFFPLCFLLFFILLIIWNNEIKEI